MREIKFRAWESILNKMLSMKEIEQSGMNLFALCEGVEIVKLMQYTGLSDKNGVEIYEGDVVEVELEDRNENPWLRKSKIIFESCTFILWDLNPSNDVWNSIPKADGPIHYYLDAEHEFEIIGNIYENPHLLEAKL